MTQISKVTKAELADEVAELHKMLNEREQQLADAREEISAAAQSIQRLATLPKVLEADALAGCIRALDPIKEANSRSSNSYNAFSSERAAWETPVRRLLVHLADRYGVSLIERTTEPCSRQHLDEVDPVTFTSALRGAVMQR